MEIVSPAKLTSLFNNVPLGFVLLDAEGKVFYLNDFFVQMAGFPREDLLGDGFYNKLFRSKESNDRIREKAKSCFQVVFDDLDMTMTTRSEDKVSIHVSGASVKDGSEVFGSLVIQDVTNKKAFEKVFESSFDNFIQVTNALDAAMKKINEQNQILEEYKSKMTRELNIAKSVQKAIIPKVFPRIPNFDMFGVSVPSEELGGDYFDYFLLDQDTIGILIADVSGHGVPSSLITTMVKAYFEYYTKRFTQPDQVLQNVNRDMAAIIMDTGFYLTAYYAVLNLKTLSLTVSTAGHDSAICVTKGKKHAIRLGEGAEGTILGIFPDAEYKSVSYQLEPDSKIIIYTDGITEARSSNGEFYGGDRLEQFLVGQLGLSSKESVDSLIKEVDTFYGTNHPNDDRTLVIFDIYSEGSQPTVDEESFKRGKKYLLEKQFALALEELEYLLHQGVTTSEVYYLAGQACSFLSKYPEAIDYLGRAIAMESDHYKSYYYLGIVQHNQKNYAEAKKSWEKVLEINGNYKDTRKLLEKLTKKP